MTIENLRKLILLPIMSITLIPFVFSWLLYSIYEQIYIRIKFRNENNPSLTRFAMKKIFRLHLFNLNRLKKFYTTSAIKLSGVRNREDVLHILNDSRLSK